MSDSELSAKLARRQDINEGKSVDQLPGQRKIFNPYTEFKEFSRKTIKIYEEKFKAFDVGKDGFIDFHELKRMMELIGAPQTHLALKQMIREVDEDQDNKISFREFLLIYRKAKDGELELDSGLSRLAGLTNIDVDVAGVGGAKEFFEAKIAEQKAGLQYELEIKAEQEERLRLEEERRQRIAAFKEKARFFESSSIEQAASS